MVAKKKSIDGAKLIKMVEDKVPRPEIMKKFNIKTSNQLTLAYARAQMEAGKGGGPQKLDNVLSSESVQKRKELTNGQKAKKVQFRVQGQSSVGRVKE